ncbi:hypothetical protein ILUMI_22558 [Ignelater luminosus]|uniref:Reverse transcriptase RNase H-like domain-containing protein n=1 Tax=Ignelater luminosus TaxID=2038154 RepID=A0A8K0CCJ8_IGNLU|nr:hypothetical protein ILUMI_22558 [Ignelater luminosus]
MPVGSEDGLVFPNDVNEVENIEDSQRDEVNEEQRMSVKEVRMESSSLAVCGNIGTLKKFNIGEDWSLYKERLDQYFLANYITEDRKVAVLLTLIGTQAYKVLRDLCDPVLPKEKSFDELCNLLQKQFAPRTSIFRKRIEFYYIKQNMGEPNNNYYVRIKNAATPCIFRNRLNEVIKDRLICGFQPGPILDRICEEAETTPVEEILETALKKEATIRESSMVNKVDVRSKVAAGGIEKINNAYKTGGVARQEKQSNNEKKCNSCDETKHNFKNCKYREYICKICKKKGHLAKVCFKNKNNYVETDDAEIQLSEICNVDSNNVDLDPIVIHVKVNNVFIEMELDTGARLSLLPERVYSKHLKNWTELFNLKVTCSDFKKLNYVRPTSGLDELLGKYSDLFKEELGLYKGEQITLKIKNDAKSVFVKPRPMPFAFKNMVDEKLKRLEELVNKHLEDFKYPLPRIDELFTALQGRESFTKLDLSHAYNQLELSPETSKLLAWKPLYKLLRVESGTFFLNYEIQQSFLKIKSVISSNDSLTYFDPNIPIKLVCDASNRGIGAVLIHLYPASSERPISFASRTLTKAELGYSVIHKEALAIVWAVQTFSQYLVGRHFTLCTDHKPLLAIFGEYKGIPKMSAGRLQRWAVFLSELDYTFKHIDGNSNVIADGLSRLPIRHIGKHTNDYDYFHFLIEDKLPVRASDIGKELQRDTLFS